MIDISPLPGQRNTLALVIVFVMTLLMSVESGARDSDDLDLAGARQCMKDLSHVGMRRRQITKLQTEFSSLKDKYYSSSGAHEKKPLKAQMDAVSNKLKPVRDLLYGKMMPAFEDACINRDMDFETYQKVCTSYRNRTRGFCSQFYIHALQLDLEGAKQCVEMSEDIDASVSYFRKQATKFEYLTTRREQEKDHATRQELSIALLEEAKSLRSDRRSIVEQEWPEFESLCLHKAIHYEPYAEVCSSPRRMNSHFCSHYVVYAAMQSDYSDELRNSTSDRAYLDPEKGLRKVVKMLPVIERQ